MLDKIFVIAMSFNPIALMLYVYSNGDSPVYYISVLGTVVLGWMLKELVNTRFLSS